MGHTFILPPGQASLGRSDRLCGAGPAVARQPDALTIDAAVQLAAATVRLHEGVAGGEQLGHAHRF